MHSCVDMSPDGQKPFKDGSKNARAMLSGNDSPDRCELLQTVTSNNF